MDVFGEGAVAVFNDDVICIRPKARVRAADVGVLFHADDAPIACSTHDRAYRDRPIDSVLTAGSRKMTETAARALHDNVTTGTERHRVVRIVGGCGPAGAELAERLIMATPGAPLVGSPKPNQLK